MTIIDRTLGFFGLERRTSRQSDPYWANFAALRGGGFTPRSAESVSAVYACVSAVAETIASLPLILYRRTPDDGRDRARDHPLYRVLHEAPNPQQTGLEFRELMQASVLLRGNAFAEIRRGYDGQVRELLPLHADRVQVLKLDTGRLGYEVFDDNGQRRRLLQEEVFHLRHRSADGALGVSPITAAREVIELAIAEREHGTATFRNGTKATGILKFPGKLSQPQREAIAQSWASQHAGAANAGKTPILEEGVDYTPVSMTLGVCRAFTATPTE